MIVGDIVPKIICWTLPAFNWFLALSMLFTYALNGKISFLLSGIWCSLMAILATQSSIKGLNVIKEFEQFLISMQQTNKNQTGGCND